MGSQNWIFQVRWHSGSLQWFTVGDPTVRQALNIKWMLISSAPLLPLPLLLSSDSCNTIHTGWGVTSHITPLDGSLPKRTSNGFPLSCLNSAKESTNLPPAPPLLLLSSNSCNTIHTPRASCGIEAFNWVRLFYHDTKNSTSVIDQ